MSLICPAVCKAETRLLFASLSCIMPWEGWKMQVAVLHGTLTETEQDYYVRQITKKFPISIVEKVILDVHEEHVDVSCMLHRFRDLRKMGGYCIGEPSDWNRAKQAEFHDTLPNRIDQ